MASQLGEDELTPRQMKSFSSRCRSKTGDGGRFSGVPQEFLSWTQFIVVSHSKKTMTCATTLYGVTMQESGVSKRVAVRFEDVHDDGRISLRDKNDETEAA